MKLLTTANYDSMSAYGAEKIYRRIADGVRLGERVNIGLATGNTMISLYKLLAEKLNANGISLKNVHTYNLDEYVDQRGQAVCHTHPLSYWSYMHENLFDRLDSSLGFTEAQAHFPDPVHPEAFDAELESSGGLHLQLLGIGFNGHIAFNEPIPEDEISVSDFAALPTRVIDLREATLQQNCRLTAGGDMDTVPRKAVTMGMKQIMAADELLLLACFPEQKTPIEAILAHGKPTPVLPASYLLVHPCSQMVYTSDTIALARQE